MTYNYPKYLPHEEQLRLFKSLPNKQARDTLIKTNMGLVLNAVARYRYTNIETEDLVSIGTIGLIKAVDVFDYNKDYKFSTCAMSYIINEIRYYLREERKNPQTVSLDCIIQDDKHENISTRVDMVEDKKVRNSIEMLIETENFLGILNYVSNQLYEKSIKRLVVLSYTLCGNTQEEIAKKFRISTARIGQLSIEIRKLWKQVSANYDKSKNNYLHFYKERDMICLEMQGYSTIKRPFERESFNDIGDVLMERLM